MNQTFLRSAGQTGIFASYAELYHRNDLSLIPIEHRTKKPAVAGWTGYCDNLPSLEALRRMIANYPDNGMGLCLGREVRSGFRLAAVDIDLPNLVRAVRALFGNPSCGKRGKKGETFFVLLEKGLKTSELKTADGRHAIDLLAGGRQTILPPTLHPDTGEPYVWTGPPIVDVPLESLPVADKRKLNVLNVFVTSEHTLQLIVGDATHEAALRLVAKLVAAGATDEEIAEIIEALLPENYEGNTLAELQGMIESARAKGFERNARLPMDEAIARQVALEMEPLIYVHGDGFLQYRDGYWPKIGDRDIDRVAKGFLLDQMKNGLVANYLRGVRQCLTLNLERSRFGERSSFLCLKNGTLDILTGELVPHSAKHELRFQLPFDYDPDANCPLYEKHVAHTFCGDQQRIDLFDEFAGLTLISNMDFQKSLFLIGKGGSGKSVCLRLVQALHDPDAICATPLDKLGSERYLTDLVRKLVCISFDIQTERKVFGESFIRITGGDPVAVRRLYQEVEGMTTPTVRFMGSMNPDMPKPSGAPDALLRRLIFLECGEPVANPSSEHEAALRKELPGILVRWTKALRRLINRGQFDIPPSSLIAVKAYLFEDEPFDTFFTECLEVDADIRTPVSAIHMAYNSWATVNGERPLSSNVVGRKMRRLGVRGGFMKHASGEDSRTARSVGVKFRSQPRTY
jgi:P4 family phage/plasmid primase-like protien